MTSASPRRPRAPEPLGGLMRLSSAIDRETEILRPDGSWTPVSDPATSKPRRLDRFPLLLDLGQAREVARGICGREDVL
jgi:hypothetical protein